MNLSYAAAGACIFAAACKHLSIKVMPEDVTHQWLAHLQKAQPGATKAMAHAAALKSMRNENLLNAGVGISTISSGLAATLIREKAHDPDAPKSSGMQGVWEWIRERPLAIAGGGYIVSTLLHAASTRVALKGHNKKHQTAVPNRVVFVAASLIAEMLVAISSKGHGEGVVSDKSVDTSIVSVAADLIVKQPAEMQEQLIRHMGTFLGRPDVLALKDEEATDLLRKEVAALQNNPWAKAEATEIKPLPAPAAKPDIAAWQARLAAAPAEGHPVIPH